MKLKVYVDLDGVLSDLNGRIQTILPNQSHPEGIPWESLYKRAPNMFLNLELLDGARLFLQDLKWEYDVEILTAIPNRWNWPKCEEHKREWVRINFGSELKVNVVPHAIEKQNFCKGEDCILIDDSQLNITQWENNYGFGILHKECLDSTHKLHDYSLKLRYKGIVLLPCPFCGHLPDVGNYEDSIHPVNREGTLWKAGCLESEGGCDARAWGITMQGVVDNWNRRV